MPKDAFLDEKSPDKGRKKKRFLTHDPEQVNLKLNLDLIISRNTYFS